MYLTFTVSSEKIIFCLVCDYLITSLSKVFLIVCYNCLKLVLDENIRDILAHFQWNSFHSRCHISYQLPGTGISTTIRSPINALPILPKLCSSLLR